MSASGEHDHPHEPHEPHAHAHAHAHDHDHDHDHDHEHEHEHEHDHHAGGEEHEHAGRGAPLEEGEGAGKILFFDAFSGTAGDMTIAALLDLGVPFSVVERAVAALPLRGFHLHRGHRHRSGIVATSFDVRVDDPQPER